MAKRKTWREKLANATNLPRTEEIGPNGTKRWGTDTMLIPAPREVDSLMRQVPHGKLLTINEIRSILARRHNATISCPITCGIFAWIAAHAAEEDAAEGVIDVTPYWRTLKTNGELNPRYPGGVERIKSLLEAEGHEVVAKGKKWLVKNYEKSVVTGVG